MRWPAAPRPSGLRIAYLTTNFPALSHSFIQREVDAMRARGATIETFAIHESRTEDVLTRTDRATQRATYTVLPPRWGHLIGAHLRAMVSGPISYLRTLGFALRLPPGGSHGQLWQLFYFIEAVPIWWQLKQRGLRHIHAHFTSPSGDVAQLVARLGNIRAGKERWSWSLTAHGTDIFNDGPALLRAKIESASLIVAVSDFGRSQLMRMAGEEHWAKIHMVRCGLDGRWFAFSGSDRRDRDDGELRLLSVGRLEVVKGHSILLDALAELRHRGLSPQLEIVGDGPRRPHLERRARQLGIHDRVSFAGPVGQDEIPRRYMGADVFCLPSLGEGVPVVLMEAMALGLPVVASSTGGIPELVEDGVTGLLAPPGRPGPLADRIERLARDSDLRQRFGAAGRRKITDGFDQERWIDELWSCFMEVADPASADSRHRADVARSAIGTEGESSQPSQPLVPGHE